MTKTPLILLALAAGAPLLAQAPGLTLANGDSSITLYGILDAGVATVAHTLDFDEYHPVAVNPTLTKKGDSSATGMFNGGISQTRVGIKGGLAIGDGWKAVFTLESAINMNSGNLSNAAEGLALNKAATGSQMSADSSVSGQIFNRGANFGLSHDTYGTLTLGRHTACMLDIIPSYDALQGAQLFTPIGFSGLYGGGGATDMSRVDNSVKYKVKIGDVTVGGIYKFGGVAGSSGAKGATELLASWEHSGFGIVGAYQKVTDATAVGNPAGSIAYNLLSYAVPDTTGMTAAQATAAVTAAKAAYTSLLAVQANGTAVYQPIGTITLTAEDTKAIMFAARYKLADFLFTAGYQKIGYTNPSNPTVDQQITNLFGYPVGTAVYGGVLSNAVNVTPFTVGGVAMEKDLTVTWLGVKYDITKKLSFAVSYYNVDQNDFSNGTTAVADKSGSTKYSSALLDYNYNKAFDAYLGYMGVQGSGGMAPVATTQYAHDSNSVLGIGLRYKF